MRLATNVPTLDPSARVGPSATAEMLDRLAREYQAVRGTVARVLMKRTVAPLARDSQLPLRGILQ
jgi:hypothetical protein